jgi:hypothetical protein
MDTPTDVLTAGGAAADAALDDAVRTARANVENQRLLARRLTRLRAGRDEGRSWHDLLAAEAPPRVMDLASGVLRGANRTSNRLRRAVAGGLRAEGAGLAAIARRLGVSHQRVSALLRSDPPDPDPPT